MKILKTMVSLLIIILMNSSPLVISNENLELIKTKSVSTISKEDYIAVCQVVSAEARGECLEGQMAVAEVIKNRSELWNMPITEVLTSKGQFTNPYMNEISTETKEAVKSVFIDEITVFGDALPTHFHSGARPYWALDENFIKQIGNHYFYK